MRCKPVNLGHLHLNVKKATRLPNSRHLGLIPSESVLFGTPCCPTALSDLFGSAAAGCFWLGLPFCFFVVAPPLLRLRLARLCFDVAFGLASPGMFCYLALFSCDADIFLLSCLVTRGSVYLIVVVPYIRVGYLKFGKAQHGNDSSM